MAHSPATFGRALREGLRLTSGNWRVPALAFAVEIAQGALFFGVQALFLGVIAAAAQRAVGAMRPDLMVPAPLWFLEAFLNELAGSSAWLPAAGAALVAVLISLVLRLFWIGFAVRSFTAALGGAPREEGLGAAAQAFGRVVSVSLLLVPLWLGSVLWRLGALGSTGMAWGVAMETREGGASASLAFALAIALAVLLELGVLFVSRLALVRAASADAGAIDAVRGGAALVVSRLGVVAALAVVFGVARIAAALVGESGGALFAGSGAEAVAFMLAARAISGVLGSLLLAVVGSAQFGAYTVLDMGERGLLPEPPAPPEPAVVPLGPVLQTEPVQGAEPTGGEPVRETEPAGEGPVLETEPAGEGPVLETEPVLDTAPAPVDEPVLDTEPAPPATEPDEEPGGPRNPVYAGI